MELRIISIYLLNSIDSKLLKYNNVTKKTQKKKGALISQKLFFTCKV